MEGCHQQVVITSDICSWKASCPGNVHSFVKAPFHQGVVNLIVMFSIWAVIFLVNVAIRLSLNFVMAPCKRQVKVTRHLICSSCSNCVDFVKSGCEKSWTEDQADSFECRGYTRMKILEVELE